MILRRITEHVKAQNWFAVGLDFLIVVVGVFIGIQVANWNDERRERQEEQTILERLAVEAGTLLEIQRQELAENEDRASLLISLNPVLFGQEEARPLSNSECSAITSSHVFRQPTDEIPILAELQETGRFDLIRDSEIKFRLRDYILLRERGRGHYREITNELFRLHSRHSEAIRIERVRFDVGAQNDWASLSGQGYRWQARCDVPALQASPQFLNELVDNASRRQSHMRFYEERIASLTAIDSALRARMGQSAGREAER